MRKKARIFTATSLLLILAVAVFLADSYAEASVKLPNRFGPLSGFVFETTDLYAEFPSLSRQLTRFKRSRAGQKFMKNPLFREFIIRPVEKKLLFLIRKLRSASGLPLDEKKITALLSRPFALLGYSRNRKMQYLGILKVNTTDRLLISVFSRMGNALYSAGTIRKEKWSGAVLYTVGSGKAGAVTFALINNALLFSRNHGMIKKALRAAAATRPDRPDNWNAFIRRNRLHSSTLCRVYFKTGLLHSVSPLLAAALYSGRTGENENRTAGISVQLNPAVTVTGGIFARPAVLLDRHTLRMTPARRQFVMSGNFNMLRTKLIGKLNSLRLGASGEKIKTTARTIAGKLGSKFTMQFSGIAEKGRQMFPSFAFSWKITPREKRMLQRQTAQLFRSLPGFKRQWKRYLGFGYTKFTGFRKSPFHPCMAILGSRLCFATTEKEIRALINSYRGRVRSLYDDPAIRAMRRRASGEKPVRLIRMDLQQILTGLYARLGNYAFRSPEFNRRDVMSVFGPVMRTGLPWKKITLLATTGRNRKYIRLQTRLH